MNIRTFLQNLGGRQKPVDEGRADLEATESATAGTVMPGLTNQEGVEAAEAELGAYDPPE